METQRSSKEITGGTQLSVYREEDPGKERRGLKLIKRLGLKGNKYNLFVLETLKKSKRGKLEEEGGWQELFVYGEYMLEIANPEHVDVKLDWEKFMILNSGEDYMEKIGKDPDFTTGPERF